MTEQEKKQPETYIIGGKTYPETYKVYNLFRFSDAKESFEDVRRKLFHCVWDESLKYLGGTTNLVSWEVIDDWFKANDGRKLILEYSSYGIKHHIEHYVREIRENKVKRWKDKVFKRSKPNLKEELSYLYNNKKEFDVNSDCIYCYCGQVNAHMCLVGIPDKKITIGDLMHGRAVRMNRRHMYSALK